MGCALAAEVRSLEDSESEVGQLPGFGHIRLLKLDLLASRTVEEADPSPSRTGATCTTIS
jgi:hypothetical protein